MDKIDQLLDIIEHPERYTDREIDTLMHDEDVRETYALLCKTRSGLNQRATIPDVEHEWKNFKSRRTKTRLMFAKMRCPSKVAASIAVIFLSLAAMAAVAGMWLNSFTIERTHPDETESHTDVYRQTTQTESKLTSETTGEKQPVLVVFDNEQLETIMANIAAYYGYEAVFKTESSKSLRLYFKWDRTQTIHDVAESLNNFQQIHLTIEDRIIRID